MAGHLHQPWTAFAQLDDTFRTLGNDAQAQPLADAFPIKRLHGVLDNVPTPAPP